MAGSWGVASCWFEAGPSALKEIFVGKFLSHDGQIRVFRCWFRVGNSDVPRLKPG